MVLTSIYDEHLQSFRIPSACEKAIPCDPDVNLLHRNLLNRLSVSVFFFLLFLGEKENSTRDIALFLQCLLAVRTNNLLSWLSLWHYFYCTDALIILYVIVHRFLYLRDLVELASYCC